MQVCHNKMQVFASTCSCASSFSMFVKKSLSFSFRLTVWLAHGTPLVRKIHEVAQFTGSTALSIAIRARTNT